jgi:protoheme IX farnesyltransferase
MVVDRDIDARMERTRNRPLVTGLIQPAEALVFAAALEVLAFALLWRFVNLLSAVLAFGAFAFYVLVYTLWLKRRHTSNIVIGGAAGAAPVLIGWAAVTNSLSWTAWLLFALIFMWTPPHFWALAIRYREDYSAASVPMLPSVASERATTNRILVYTVAVAAITLALVPVADLGPVFAVIAGVACAAFLAMAVALRRSPTPKLAMRLFGYSITFISVIFGTLALDPILGIGWPG